MRCVKRSASPNRHSTAAGPGITCAINGAAAPPVAVVRCSPPQRTAPLLTFCGSVRLAQGRAGCLPALVPWAFLPTPRSAAPQRVACVARPLRGGAPASRCRGSGPAHSARCRHRGPALPPRARHRPASPGPYPAFLGSPSLRGPAVLPALCCGRPPRCSGCPCSVWARPGSLLGARVPPAPSAARRWPRLAPRPGAVRGPLARFVWASGPGAFCCARASRPLAFGCGGCGRWDSASIVASFSPCLPPAPASPAGGLRGARGFAFVPPALAAFFAAYLTSSNICATLFLRGLFRSQGGCPLLGIHGRQKPLGRKTGRFFYASRVSMHTTFRASLAPCYIPSVSQKPLQHNTFTGEFTILKK